MIIQPIVDIAEICAQKGIKHIVLSPGSRCAHLAIAFVRHPQLKTYTVSDERSAAFVALGMAQQTGQAVALLCTSGTAALNYYPAIAEAFYQHIPLVVFTADRPDEWIDQLDGQTIRQQNVYANHIKKSYHLPADYSHPDAVWHAHRSVNEAINLAQHGRKGPVHINVPIREPFYPESHEEMVFDPAVRIIKSYSATPTVGEDMLAELLDKLRSNHKIMILAGQQDQDADLQEVLGRFAQNNHIPILADVISNMPLDHTIAHTDITLFDKSQQALLQPDLVISFGKSLLSKNLKAFLKAYRPQCHIHLQHGAEISDYSQSQDFLIDIQPVAFFEALVSHHFNTDDTYLNLWKSTAEGFMQKLQNHFVESEFSEFEGIYEVINHLPEHSILHLANSMSVRYANYLKINKTIEVHANRGTSGIDGSTSTAVGCAMTTDKIVTLITGDMAFLYDRNALWNNYLPSNLRIVVMNNHAGGIFRIIEGPNKQPELETYFETNQKQNVKNTVADAAMDYILCERREELKEAVVTFFEKGTKGRVMEIPSNTLVNTKVLKAFTACFKK